MKKKILSFGFILSFMVICTNIFAAKGELYSNAAGDKFCCCPGGEKECNSGSCAASVCNQGDVEL